MYHFEGIWQVFIVLSSLLCKMMPSFVSDITSQSSGFKPSLSEMSFFCSLVGLFPLLIDATLLCANFHELRSILSHKPAGLSRQ